MAKNNPPVAHMQNTGHSWLEEQQPAQPPYSVLEFPKRLHHKNGSSTVINTPDEQAKLGADYAESPAVHIAAANKAAAEKAASEKK